MIEITQVEAMESGIGFYMLIPIFIMGLAALTLAFFTLHGGFRFRDTLVMVAILGVSAYAAVALLAEGNERLADKRADYYNSTVLDAYRAESPNAKPFTAAEVKTLYAGKVLEKDGDGLYLSNGVLNALPLGDDYKVLDHSDYRDSGVGLRTFMSLMICVMFILVGVFTVDVYGLRDSYMWVSAVIALVSAVLMFNHLGKSDFSSPDFDKWIAATTEEIEHPKNVSADKLRAGFGTYGDKVVFREADLEFFVVWPIEKAPEQVKSPKEPDEAEAEAVVRNMWEQHFSEIVNDPDSPFSDKEQAEIVRILMESFDKE